MQRARTGDVDAFAIIYDRHAPVLLSVGRRMLTSAAEADDLLHDVFLEAWQAVREYDATRASVRTWLLVRARSRALDRLGRRTRESNARSAVEPPNEAALVRAAAQYERDAAVRRAIETLEPSVRETLELTYYAGMTADEIAERMHAPVGTVKSRLARGLRKLTAALTDDGGTTHGE